MPLHTDLTVELLFVAATLTSLRETESPSNYEHRFNRQDDEDLPPDDVIVDNSAVHCKSTSVLWQGRSQDFTLGATEAERRRHWGGGVHLPNRLGGLGRWVRGVAPVANAFLAYLRPTEHLWSTEQCYFNQFFTVKKSTQSTMA